MNKYNEAIGLFWGASLFLGGLISVFVGFSSSNWVFGGIVGGLSFLICGLVVQGIITLMQKTK